VHGPALAHKASDEGVIAVEDAAGLTTHPIASIDIPRATFGSPTVARSGWPEAHARQQGHDLAVRNVQYCAVGAGRGVAGGGGGIAACGWGGPSGWPAARNAKA